MVSDSIRIGRIFGIDIELHWTFVVLTLLFLIPPFFIFGLIWILLFICVLIHELAHSVTARRNGLKVKRIILLPFGGASIIENIELDPKVEFNISIAGPIMSLLLGGIFGIISIFTPIGFFTRIAYLLFLLNIFLGVLNILPAFPMDGGRVFRSYLRTKYDRYKATTITVRVSMVMLVLIVVATVGYLFYVPNYSLVTKEFDLVLTLFVVWFLYGGAKAEEYSMIVRKGTQHLGISGAISRHFVLVDENRKVESLYKLVSNAKLHIVMTKTAKGYSIVDLSKVKKAGPDAPVGSISVSIPVIQPRMNAAEAFYKMEGENSGLAAVVSKGKLVGIVTYQQLQTLISLHMLKNKKSSKA